jgi:hypothetical protein
LEHARDRSYVSNKILLVSKLDQFKAPYALELDVQINAPMDVQYTATPQVGLEGSWFQLVKRPHYLRCEVGYDEISTHGVVVEMVFELRVILLKLLDVRFHVRW